MRAAVAGEYGSQSRADPVVANVATALARNSLLLRDLPATPAVQSWTSHALLRVFPAAFDWSGGLLSAAELTSLRQETSEAPTRSGLQPLDDQLIAALIEDGRASHTDLAHRADTTALTARRRPEALVGGQVIRLATEVDLTRLGIRAEALLWITVAPRGLEETGRQLSRHPQGRFTAAYTGPANLLVAVAAADLDALHQFMSDTIGVLEHISAVEVAPILTGVKRTVWCDRAASEPSAVRWPISGTAHTLSMCAEVSAMARAVWSGVLTFGLVTVPVQLFTATETHTIHFHQLQRGTLDRVRNKRVNERTGEEVPFDEIVKGFDTGEGEYVIVDPEELDEIAPGRSRAIDISGFVDLDSIDPVFFDRTYYLGPKGEEYGKVYALLREALASARKAGVATFVMRSHEYLVALKAEAGVLTMHTLHWADEVRDPSKEISTLPGKTKATDKELSMAGQLIDTLSIDWTPEEWHDTFQEKVAQLLKAKQAGEPVEKAAPPPKSTNVIDLMEALQASVDRARSPKAHEKKAGTGTRRTSRRKKTAASAHGQRSTAGRRAPTTAELRDLTKAELYQRAADADVPGRSSMNRDELIHALAPGGGRKARAS